MKNNRNHFEQFLVLSIIYLLLFADSTVVVSNACSFIVFSKHYIPHFSLLAGHINRGHQLWVSFDQASIYSYIRIHKTLTEVVFSQF